MAEHLEHTNGIGNPDYAALRNESIHWIELGEWAKAETALERIVEMHGRDKEREKEMAAYVLPDLGHVYLAQKKVVEAKTVLAPLVADEESRPSSRTLTEWAQSITGWLEGGPTNIVHVPGASGSDDEYELVVRKLDALSNSRSMIKWSDCVWYEVKFMIAFAYFAWSKENSSKEDSTRRQLDNIRIQTGSNDFTSIDGNCDDPETSPPDVMPRLGGGVLRSWFQWLARQ
jgi:hypothetical protein